MEIVSHPLVLDASALIADIKNEPGAESVREITEAASGNVYLHAVNASEVAYHLICIGLSPMLAFYYTSPKGVTIVGEIEQRLWKRSATLKAEYRNLSLADCIVIAFAESMKAELLTGDRLFQKGRTTAAITLFR